MLQSIYALESLEFKHGRIVHNEHAYEVSAQASIENTILIHTNKIKDSEIVKR